jgi:hypothetical protein
MLSRLLYEEASQWIDRRRAEGMGQTQRENIVLVEDGSFWWCPENLSTQPLNYMSG